ncbi:MAG: DUF4825 domain-containing protein, partial [Firmicutes bacterium]|nr:DUF4825 domain-containing protein [Bacillota bacterium]
IGFVLSWFNPVIHIAFHTFRRDIEVRCDNVAIEKLGERREYAETLVRAAAGQKRFVLASTSFLGGEKEVVERVKRIAGARKRKVVLEVLGTLVIVLAVVACTSVPASGPVENVALGENWQIDVPEKWLGDMRTVTEEEYNYEEADAIQPGSKRFYNKDGVEIAFAFIAEDVFSQEEYLSITKHVAPDGTPVSTLEITDELIEERVDGTVERYFEKGYTDIAKLPLPDSEITMKEGASFFQYVATKHYLSSIGDPTEDFVITVMHRNGTVVILAARQGEAKTDELLEYVDSFRTVRYDEISGIQLSGIEEFRNLPEGMKRPELTKEAYEEYVERTLQDAFSWYVLGDYPVEIALGGYWISDIEPITEVSAPEEGEKPGKADYYWDVPRWDIIYPHARAYKVTYSLTPENEKYYEGETEFERIAVFAVNTYVSPIYDGSGAMPESHVSHNPPYYVPADFYFLGFVDKAEADFYGQDQEILYMLDQWFMTLNPMSDPYYRTEYIGNAPEVAKVVNSLPLHEYIDMSEGTFTDNAIRIQTAEEPYGLIVHYTFNFKLTSTSDEIWFTPVNSRQQEIMNSPINKYVESQLMMNINQLYDRIGNVGEIDLVVHYVDERSEGSVPTATYTIHTSREYFYNI